MSPEEYMTYRRSLWAKRGPNVQTKGDDQLLPCYVHALEKCDPTFQRPDAPKPLQCTAAAEESIVDAMRQAVAGGVQEPFYVIDLAAATERLALWRSELPEIHPHYAVKCNGDPALLLTLAHAGVSFDCASKAEIEAVLKLGVPPSRIVYANPIKQPSHVRFAAEHAVGLTVFDAEDELEKVCAKESATCTQHGYRLYPCSASSAPTTVDPLTYLCLASCCLRSRSCIRPATCCCD